MRISHTSRHHPLHRRRRTIRVPFGAQRFLAVFEGIEGGFAIGASVIAGLSLAGMNRQAIIITAIVSVIVSGFNAAAVKYSSEHYRQQQSLLPILQSALFRSYPFYSCKTYYKQSHYQSPQLSAYSL